MTEMIIELIRDACAISEPSLSELSQFSEISIDSLSFIEMIVRMEQEFDIEFDDEELNIKDFETVRDMIELVEGKVNEK